MVSKSEPKDVLNEEDLIEKICSSQSSSTVISTVLKTDERVLARVTDGIYRQPGSALRELISNAYDADATRVVVKTDAPRFERISVEDNGHGMGPDTLAHLLHHIGGSAKRSEKGSKLGVTDVQDPFKSPGGRRLIGKIGIGLFSVSQLTHAFQIITKVKDDPYRTIATVALKQYSEADVPIESESQKKFESGKVNIWREKASDVASHGTTIILTSIRPQARDTLRSRDIWAAIEQSEASSKGGASQIDPPRYHIGRVDPSSGELLKKTAGKLNNLPWDKSDSPEGAFRKLVNSVWKEVEHSNPNPQLEKVLDYYLRMIWQLSLAMPLPYVDGNPFDLDFEGNADVFALSNSPKGSATRVDVDSGQTIRDALNLQELLYPPLPFDVYFDDLKLLRPIKFKDLPVTSHALKNPIICIGQCREEFAKVPRELSGGPLSFEAYLFWTPKVAPTEHRGSLIRIYGSSGTLFDSGFMRYQVSEQTRLAQITCEIFVSEGLDSALNIDRESFNFAHPHSVFITKWLHSALRQLATTQKKLASEVRGQARESAKDVVSEEIIKVVSEFWHREADDPAAPPPEIEFTDTGEKKSTGENADAFVFSRPDVISVPIGARTQKARSRQSVLEAKLKAIAQVLATYGLLDAVPKKKQERLLNAIYRILEAAED